MSRAWYEVWADDGLAPPYVLLVVPRDNGTVAVFDPKENKVVYEAPGYEDVKLWLLEDEYRLVEGRMIPDQP
jgi:hypothetical protein